MLQADIFNYHRVEYIVIDTAVAALDKAGLVRLASYRHGVGADRLLLVDKSLGQMIAAVDGRGSYQLMTMDDCRVADAALGRAGKPADMHYRELRVTDYFLEKLLPLNGSWKIAG